MDLERILEDNGCEVVALVRSAKQGIEMVSRESIDVALLDYLLEDGTADPLCHGARRERHRLRVVHGRSRRDVIRYPDAPVIGKPFCVDDVYAAVDGLVPLTGLKG